MSLVQTPADDPKMAAEEDHEVAAATKSGRPTAKDAALLAFVSSIGPFAANAYVPAFDEIGRYYGVGLVTVQQTLSIYLAAFACTSLDRGGFGCFRTKGCACPLNDGICCLVAGASFCRLDGSVLYLAVCDGDGSGCGACCHSGYRSRSLERG